MQNYFQVPEEASPGAAHEAVEREVTGVTPGDSDDQTLTNNKRHNMTMTHIHNGLAVEKMV